ncbi:hypothetical protein KSP40_PGU009351 [Platanthera guangdongensis]|uniref:Uncharacterized protein n=1 Tax=Platanthera guangdongensis TaxID=2320717 RepID=A0ABR2N5L7_9ASPA
MADERHPNQNPSPITSVSSSPLLPTVGTPLLRCRSFTSVSSSLLLPTVVGTPPLPMSSSPIDFIFDAAARHCVEIATHQHGCCVLQCCISRSTGDHYTKLIYEISSNGLLLARDPFG